MKTRKIHVIGKMAAVAGLFFVNMAGSCEQYNLQDQVRSIQVCVSASDWASGKSVAIEGAANVWVNGTIPGNSFGNGLQTGAFNIRKQGSTGRGCGWIALSTKSNGQFPTGEDVVHGFTSLDFQSGEYSDSKSKGDSDIVLHPVSGNTLTVDVTFELNKNSDSDGGTSASTQALNHGARLALALDRVHRSDRSAAGQSEVLAKQVQSAGSKADATRPQARVRTSKGI